MGFFEVGIPKAGAFLHIRFNAFPYPSVLTIRMLEGGSGAQ